MVVLMMFIQGVSERMLGSLDRHECTISAEDLKLSRAEWVSPIACDYRGFRVHELPPNGQGLTVLQMLKMLEQWSLADYGPHPPEWWHLFIECKKLAFEDRARFIADPTFAKVPVRGLIDGEYSSARAALIGERALESPVHGDPLFTRGDTTYLSVADQDGMMVSLIQSIYNGFGSGLVPDQCGFAMQCRGAGFSLDSRHPNVYAPGKRPFHTIIPAFVTRDDEPFMSLGVMGADMQPQGQVQVLVNMLDFGVDPDAAGRLPRMRHDSINNPNHTRPPDAGVVWHEDGFDASMLATLRSRGHDIRPAEHPVAHFMGGYQCVRRETGGYSAASEPRFDGCAIAQ